MAPSCPVGTETHLLAGELPKLLRQVFTECSGAVLCFLCVLTTIFLPRGSREHHHPPGHVTSCHIMSRHVMSRAFVWECGEICFPAPPELWCWALPGTIILLSYCAIFVPRRVAMLQCAVALILGARDTTIEPRPMLHRHKGMVRTVSPGPRNQKNCYCREIDWHVVTVQ